MDLGFPIQNVPSKSNPHRYIGSHELLDEETGLKTALNYDVITVKNLISLDLEENIQAVSCDVDYIEIQFTGKGMGFVAIPFDKCHVTFNLKTMNVFRQSGISGGENVQLLRVTTVIRRPLSQIQLPGLRYLLLNGPLAYQPFVIAIVE